MFFGLLIAVAGSVIYHLSMKKLPTGLNPFFSLSAIYLGALILSLLGMLVYSDGSRQLADLKLSMIGIALGVIGIEAGFLLAYRAGWNVGYTALAVNALSVLLLLPVAMLVMKEDVSITKMIGIVLCLGGLSLLLKP